MDPEAGRTIGSVMARTFWSIARVIAVCYAVIVIYALLASERMIFQPPAARNVQDRVTAIESRDGERIGFFSDVTDIHRMTILFSHGNAEDLSTVPGFLEELSAMGFNTASYDYRGYGISDGTPSVKKGYKDAEAAYRYVRDTLGIPESRIIVHGRSLGAAYALHQAVEFKPAGLIMESGFTSAYRVMTRRAVLPFDKLNNLRRIRDLRCPVLLFHGTEDRVIPAWHSQKLQQAAPTPATLVLVNGAGHNNLYSTDPETYQTSLHQFLTTLPAARDR